MDFLTIIPWIALLLVFLGMAALQWRALSALHELAKLLAQQLSGRPVPVAAVAAPPLAPAALPPARADPAKPSGPFDAAPPWFQFALHEIGFHETGDNQGIGRYIDLAHCGALGQPWCAIFTNASLEAPTFQDGSPKLSVPGSRSPSSQSFLTDPNFIKLDKPVRGCLVIFWRDSPNSGLGHAGFYDKEDADHIWTLGGNENDMVQDEPLPKQSATFGLIGYYWPKSVPLPNGGPVLIGPPKPPASSAISEFSALVPGGYFSSAPFDKGIPASMRTNNPGALNVAPWIKTAPGYVGDKVTSMSGAEANSTVIFSAPEYGVAAWFALLQKYRAAGATTLSAIINRYGGGQDYSSYVGEVAAWSGLGEQAEIDLDDDAVLLAFGKAMFRYEAGRPSPLSDAQILYGFNLARGRVAKSAAVPPAPPTPAPHVT